MEDIRLWKYQLKLFNKSQHSNLLRTWIRNKNDHHSGEI